MKLIEANIILFKLSCLERFCFIKQTQESGSLDVTNVRKSSSPTMISDAIKPAIKMQDLSFVR